MPAARSLLDSHCHRYRATLARLSARHPTYLHLAWLSILGQCARALAQTVSQEPLIDASLVEHGGRWWMFASMLGVTRRCKGLVIFHAERPLGVCKPTTT